MGNSPSKWTADADAVRSKQPQAFHNSPYSDLMRAGRTTRVSLFPDTSNSPLPSVPNILQCVESEEEKGN
ncbi:hypothetical protein RRH01S_01_00420 [Rhizobium rhizogenes NBRC 13257]|uniref:Uncharacterized protein n=1 Tax=Rhizobium rhizogenes NBRC 13257 TaxID=1220581 RepID=A0AA87Q6H4_RHIRH|nr:hypothetical protein RRH01S_01_00420 [Rhizobium rhizogenes NBRC 13257]